MARKLPSTSKETGLLGIGAFLAAIGASVCCAGPLLLLFLGVGGAWMSTLTSLQEIRPFFIILTLIFISLGYRNLFLASENCVQDKEFASPVVLQKQRIIFCITSFLILLLLAFPWYAPLLIE